MIVYEGVKTEDNSEIEDIYSSARNKTTHVDDNITSLHRIAKACDPNRMLSRDNFEKSKKTSVNSTGFKKLKTDRDSQEPKGKYRCRVNQYVFEKKKSYGGKK
jgi:hypothetical protein